MHRAGSLAARQEKRFDPFDEPKKVRACPDSHATSLASLSSVSTGVLIRLGCSHAVRAARAVFASPRRLPAATSYRAVAAGASSGARKVRRRRQGSNSCLIRPLPCVPHTLCGPFRGGR